MIKCEVLIIGAGFAGAASAWHLAEEGVRDVVIVERESMPGMHASGQNASMMRQFEEDEIIADCAFKGAGFILTPPFKWEKIIDQVGSLILYKKARKESIQKAIEASEKRGLESRIISNKKAQSIVPILKDADFDGAVHTVTDGVVDINKYLWSYIKDAKENGINLRLNEKVLDIKRNRDDTYTATTEKEAIVCRKIVNAAGAWSSEIGKLAGADEIDLRPLRRHLYTTTPMPNVQNNWPFVWDIDHQYYFRPESGGLLIGPCDEDLVSPGVPSTLYDVREILADKLGNYCPRLMNISIATEWAGLRTFSPDRRFVIGEDKKASGFIWAAGLGGFGVTTSYMIGKYVADAIIREGELIPKEFRPDRF